jgi:uncharacterized membrane protein (UPF0127 family)
MASSFLTPLVRDPERRFALRHLPSGRVLARRVEAAFDSQRRRKGLLGRTSLDADTALVLAPCAAIHTFFMSFAIDVLFVRRDGRIMKACRAVRPWRIRLAPGSFAVVEFGAGALERTGAVSGGSVELAAE